MTDAGWAEVVGLPGVLAYGDTTEAALSRVQDEQPLTLVGR
jgi:hypothetical protein